ncbi:MAG: anaerobic carbon-monoxide dehydrogenase catalytic subunit [bacterium]|nr:anaerobic carbon-monoxide dehydrogenase catalytic subunit [bacterium]
MAEKCLTVCSASESMIAKAEQEGVSTAFSRSQEIKPCPFGVSGTCCRNCAMGPCRLTFKGEVTEEEQELGSKRGVCGATVGTISARNFARMIAAGASAHSDHGREVAQTFLAAAKKEIPGYDIKDEVKLRTIAGVLDISTDNKDKYQIAREVGEVLIKEFGKQEGELAFVKRAPEKRQRIWAEHGITPRGIDREVVETMHRTSIGVDQDYRNILLHGSRNALADGWGGSMIATELQDIMFGTPIPLRSKVNLGVLKEDEVNIIVHGHEPLLSEMIVVASRDPELLDLAKKVGAKGINLAGICCTANEILMRQGVPIAGNFLQQELAILTGAVEAMVVDVQCVMQSLPSVAKCYHTEIITTAEKARMSGTSHFEFHPHHALEVSKDIVRRAIKNFPKRKSVNIPKEEMDLVAGFSHETVNYMLGGSFRSSYRPLNDNIINGRIRGVAGVVGCNNPKVPHDKIHTEVVKELIANDVLVLQTGCSAIACAKEGLLIPEAALKYAGPGLREVCETVGIPPVLHCGSCVDNSRLLIAATEMVKEGGLGNDISDLPVVGCAPEWMSEKAIAIGQYFVASGVYVVFGVTFPVTGSKGVSDFLFEEHDKITGGKWAFEPDPHKMAALMLDRINKARKALGIDKPQERVLYDMEMRRELKF